MELSQQLPNCVVPQAEYAAYLRSAVGSCQDLPKGSCIVQTPSGMVDASISVQLGNLKNLFYDLE